MYQTTYRADVFLGIFRGMSLSQGLPSIRMLPNDCSCFLSLFESNEQVQLGGQSVITINTREASGNL